MLDSWRHKYMYVGNDDDVQEVGFMGQKSVSKVKPCFVIAFNRKPCYCDHRMFYDRHKLIYVEIAIFVILLDLQKESKPATEKMITSAISVTWVFNKMFYVNEITVLRILSFEWLPNQFGPSGNETRYSLITGRQAKQPNHSSSKTQSYTRLRPMFQTLERRILPII